MLRLLRERECGGRAGARRPREATERAASRWLARRGTVLGAGIGLTTALSLNARYDT